MECQGPNGHKENYALTLKCKCWRVLNALTVMGIMPKAMGVSATYLRNSQFLPTSKAILAIQNRPNITLY